MLFLLSLICDLFFFLLDMEFFVLISILLVEFERYFRGLSWLDIDVLLLVHFAFVYHPFFQLVLCFIIRYIHRK